MSKIQIAPSVLACNFARLGEEIKAAEVAGADVIHLDIMDGHFVPNLTFGAPIIKHCRKFSTLPFDAHLMVENPDMYFQDLKDAGCDWISVHIEACAHINRTLSHIKSLNMKPGVAINPGTSLTSIDAVLDDVEYILLMSVNPGFGGQKFVSNSIERLRTLKKMIGSRNIQIQIDGGVNVETIGKIADAGAEIMVVGSGFYGAEDYSHRVKELRSACA